ncbi:MAG TPA: glutamate-ammonia-ligase adenylyltransferase [Spirochaetia bacterium]|nr:glutamate-ammonia-ligase adenylyltransferase [Spirochaetia bacterium]
MGKPTAGELKRACPQVSHEFLEQFLSMFGERYYQRFGAQELAEHASALAALSDESVSNLLIKPPMQGTVEVTITGYNYTGIFSAITGLLAATGLEIVSGEIFTSALSTTDSESPAGSSGRRRYIVDLFTGRLREGLGPGEWKEACSALLGEVSALYHRGDEESLKTAKTRIYENVVRALAEVSEVSSFLLPVELSVDESSEAYTRLRVVAEDTPFFLFALSNALAQHDVSIEHVRISTMDNRIEDEIDFVDSHGKPITDPQALNQIKLSVLVTKQFTYFLGNAPDPYTALRRFESIAREILSTPSEESWHRLLASPRILEDLARLLGTSDFLWEDFIRGQYEEILPMLSPSIKTENLSHPQEELEAMLAGELGRASTTEEKRVRLNEFKDNEIYLIDLDHLVTPGTDFLFLSRKLTVLAEVVVRAAVSIVWENLVAEHGLPRTFAGITAQYAILGLGKFGGQALGYASDIELLFVYSDSGTTDGVKRIANREFFEILFREAVGLIEAKREGIFHIDLRLRPYGRNSPIATSLETFCRYYGPGGEAHSYEKLSLVRMRAIGGDLDFARRVERLRDEMIYSSDAINLKDLRELRNKQFAEKTEGGRVNAKFSPGALVDLEYSVQIIQCMYGKDNPALRTPRIHIALDELVRTGYMSGDEASDLVEAYHFLRRLINGLRMLRGSAQDLYMPPVDSDEYTHLARRTGYTKQFGLSPSQLLHLEFESRTATVRSFVERHLGRDSLPGPPVGNAADLVLSDTLPDALRLRVLAEGGFTNPDRAIRNLRALAGEGRRRQLFARLSVLAWDILGSTPDPDMALNNWERLISEGGVDPEEQFTRLLSQPKRLDILLAIFSGSQFLADSVIREPDLLTWVSSPDQVRRVRTKESMLADLREISTSAVGEREWRRAIRRLRRREILRIGTRDICLSAPLEEIVLELSNLADALLEAVIERRMQALPDPEHFRELGFCILAFGKLGGRELNYSSDIDLLGVYRHDGTESDSALCSSLLEGLRSDLSDHTSEGYVYRVDFRLRPYGTSGPLVQPLGSILAYYRESAALWEFQALLKLRPVAGDLEAGEELLSELHPLIFREWDPREIRETIVRLRNSAEKQSAAHGSNQTERFIDVKTGAGGIRDVEFLLQGIQLSTAFKKGSIVTGNTLTGLRLAAEEGLLDMEAAATLREDYLFLRRVEHFLQLYEDRQVHSLPEGMKELESLARRIAGKGATAEQFLSKIEQTRMRVRSTYEKQLEILGTRSS